EHRIVHGNAMRADPRLIAFQILLLPILVLVPDFTGPYGSGLTTAVSVPVAPGRVLRQAYSSCDGWIGGRSDCWASKGFLRLTIRPAPGVEIDVYNTHLDSGGSESAQATRKAQLVELAEAIERDSAGRA